MAKVMEGKEADRVRGEREGVEGGQSKGKSNATMEGI